jgi:hypothetical protein
MEEAFFVPCTRMHDLMRAWNADHEHTFPENIDFEEVELRAGAGNGAGDFFHHPDFTFDNFWKLTHRKIVWMGPEIFVEALAADENVRYALYDFRECFEFETIFSVRPATHWDLTHPGWYNALRVCSRSMTNATTTICDYVFQLMTRSNTIWTNLEINVLPSVSTLALSRFLKNSRSSGGIIRFDDDYLKYLSQDHLREYLRVLESSTGPHHRIELRRMKNWTQLLTVPLADFLQRCQCAIVVRCWVFPVPSLIPDALRGD